MNPEIIDFIQEELIGRGLAYVLSMDIGTFICVHKYPLHIQPIQYPILQEHMRDKTDYPVWAPYVDGQPSPWGNGQCTANMYLLLNQYNQNQSNNVI